MAVLTHGSLFSGIGGFDLAAEWMGWENKFHCEWNTFGQRVLHHYWPNAEQFTDITKSDFTKYANKIDILTGGFPCQPYSLAGKRKGKADERHLWPEMLRAIREIQPRWVVGENVYGLINWNGGLVFNEVQSDLEAAGYEVWPYVLPACAVNAPHRRDRVWFVAHAVNGGHHTRQTTFSEENRISKEYRQEVDPREFDGTGFSRIASNTTGESSERMRPEQREFSEQEQRESGRNSGGMGDEWDAADTNDKRLQGKTENRNLGRERFMFSRSTEKQQWQNFPTQSPICSRNDGLPAGLDGITFSKWRNESIKAAGNAIVPQVALQIFKAIDQHESNN